MYEEIFNQIRSAANKRNLKDSTIHAYCTSVAHFLNLQMFCCKKNECLKFFDRIYREGVKCKWVINNELSCEEGREVCLEKYLTGKICRFNFLINFDLGKRY